jgi:acetyl esterase/lipase
LSILAYILSGLSLLMSVPLLVKVKIPLAFHLMPAKLAAGALSTYWAIMGAAGAVIGGVYEAYWAVPMGVVGAGVMISYVWRCSRAHKGFERALGARWSDQIPPEQARHMVRRRWSFFLSMKASPKPSWERDLAYWTVPGTQREVLCDLWRPANGDVSGLAFIFFHGSGWFALDKDFGTRPLFRHLVAQGHTVMDVAYRLCPEVDIYGMIGDVKRAIAWMKTNASRYGVNPEKVVLGGGSAGAHLAMLAAYAPEHPELTPEDMKGDDLSVCGVVSYYGNSDLLASKHWTDVKQAKKEPPVPIGTVLEPKMRIRYAGRLDILLGGYPQDALPVYQLASPINHVHPGCPPTLLIQGEQDLLVPVDTTRALYAKLVESGVPAINVVFPWTEHVFDLPLPQINPAAQSALYDVDRFLALLLSKN